MGIRGAQDPDRALGIAFLGAVLIGLGSCVAILAPGDGQTGMVCYPLWMVGGILGIIAIRSAVAVRTDWRSSLLIGLLAVLSLLSVVWAFIAAMNYVPVRTEPGHTHGASWDG